MPNLSFSITSALFMIIGVARPATLSFIAVLRWMYTVGAIPLWLPGRQGRHGDLPLHKYVQTIKNRYRLRTGQALAAAFVAILLAACGGEQITGPTPTVTQPPAFTSTAIPVATTTLTPGSTPVSTITQPSPSPTSAPAFTSTSVPTSVPTPTPSPSSPTPGPTPRKAPDDVTIHTFPSGGEGPRAMMFDGDHIWATHLADSTVSKWSLDGTLVGTYSAGNRPRSLAFDGENVWVANGGTTP